MEDVVTASPLVLQTSGSDLGLEPGMKITVRELLYALLLKSANDAGMALAGHDPAGYEHFIALMNAKARSLGAYDSSFRNPHGLDQIGHVSSARDMAIFARELVADPILREISGTRVHTMTWKGRSRLYGHHHKLLRRDPSVIAGKTGFTNQAGHSLITVADTSAGRLVAVVMGSSDLYTETSNLFTYGKMRSSGEASGGGSVEGYGRLPAPPAPPDEALPLVAPRGSDPRDDMRWSILMMVLGLFTGATLISRRRRSVTADAGVYAWLSQLAADERRRRR
jgi:D-alanyl-D-alanine carboxypeptidase